MFGELVNLLIIKLYKISDAGYTTILVLVGNVNYAYGG
jgi:hypothetical protein